MNPTELLAYFLGALASLLTIVNPPIAVPLFIALSSHLTPAERNLQILRISTNVAAILLCVLIFGGLLLQIFGISLGAIRVAGGLIIAFLGFRMLFPAQAHDHDPADKELRRDDQDSDFSFVPLAMPTLAGPGSMAVVLGFSTVIEGRKFVADRVAGYLATGIAIMITATIVWIVLRSSGFIAKRLGSHGLTALTRVMGFLMVCIGIQFIPSGVQELLKQLRL